MSPYSNSKLCTAAYFEYRIDKNSRVVWGRIGGTDTRNVQMQRTSEPYINITDK